jgi:hypothetical protein
MNTALKTKISDDVVKMAGISADQLNDESVIEVLVSDESIVRSVLDHRLVGRLVAGQRQWSNGDLVVAGVALQLSYLKADGENLTLVKFVQGKQRAVLAAAFAGEWKGGNPFRLTTASAIEVLDAIKAAKKTQRGIEIRANVKAAKAAIAQLEADGVDAFLANWGDAINGRFPWALDVLHAARTGVWASDGSTFKMDGRNACRVIEAAKRINETWDRANRVNATK